MLVGFKYATICTKMQKIKLWVKYAKSISMLKIFHKNFGFVDIFDSTINGLNM